MRYLIIDTGGQPLAETFHEARIQAFVSNPEIDGDDPCDGKLASPNTADVERALALLTNADPRWDGTREFFVVPLEGAYTVNVQRGVEVTSTGGRA